MFLRYYEKVIFLIAISIVAGGFFLTTKSRNTIINIPQKDIPLPEETKIILPSISVPTPFDESLNITETQFPDKICNIADYGAVPGGKIKNTKSFADAITACAADGGGKVVVSAGVWLTGPIKLSNNINLEIQKDAVVLFSDEFSDYLPPVFSRFEGIEYYNYSPLISASDSENIAITGEGTLNGQGEAWWKFSGLSIEKLYSMGENGTPVDQRVFGTVADGLRPSFIEFVNCNRILISGVSIQKGPMWTVHPIYSQNIIIKDVNIATAPGPSTDGIVIDSSKNVLVDNATLATGDDAIVIKSGRDNDGRRINLPSENIVLQNIAVTESHGAIALGSEMSANIQNVLAQNITIKNSQYAFRIKSNQQRGGEAKNIWLKKVDINSLSIAVVQLNAYYERRATGYTDFPPLFQSIHIEDITCRSTASSINLFGLENNLSSISNLSFKNIDIQKARSGVEINSATGISLENVSIIPKYGPAIDIVGSQDITISNFACKNPRINCFHVIGANTANIHIDQKDPLTKTDSISIEKEVDENQVTISQQQL